MNIRTVLANPHSVAAYLAGPEGPPYVIGVKVKFNDLRLVVLEVEMMPLPPMEAQGYPIEKVILFVARSRAIACPPADDRRRWEHTLGQIHPKSKYTAFCLWYPDDPVELRWMIDQPIEELIGIVFRHVQAEEYFRRNGDWLIPEAPHGAQGPLPITGDLAKATTQRRAS